MWCWRRLLRVPWTARRSNQSIQRRPVLGVHWKDWCWSWNSNTLATWCEELTHLERPWYWERLRAGGEGDDRGWDGWMSSLTQWTWVCVNSGSWWWTGRPGMLQFMGLQRVGHDWVTELNWTDEWDSYKRKTLFKKNLQGKPKDHCRGKQWHTRKLKSLVLKARANSKHSLISRDIKLHNKGLFTSIAIT